MRTNYKQEAKVCVIGFVSLHTRNVSKLQENSVFLIYQGFISNFINLLAGISTYEIWILAGDKYVVKNTIVTNTVDKILLKSLPDEPWMARTPNRRDFLRLV